MHDGVSDRVVDIIKDILDAENIDLNNQHDLDLDWDSLKHLDIILALEQEFDISVPIEKIEEFYRSIESIIEFIRKNNDSSSS